MIWRQKGIVGDMKTEGRLIITCRGDRGSNKLTGRGVHYWERLGSYINSLQVGGR